jgi:two-component system CheB/CheR fusion protein
LEVALDLTGACSWTLDAQGERLEWLPDPVAIVGWQGAALSRWTELLARTHPDDRAVLAELPVRREAGSASVRIEAPDGGWRYVCFRTAARDPGAPTVGIVVDETPRRDARRSADMRLADLQHRIRNMVAIIRSMAHRTRETSEDLEGFSAHFEGRLGAFARTHSALARTERGDADLEEIIREELRETAFPNSEPWTLEGPQVRLRHKTAELMTLAIHELVTNSVKYGALATRGGQIAVTWALIDDGALRLDWVETTPDPVEPPTKVGFGRELIEQGLPYQLGARTSLEFERSGVRCRIEVPFDAGAAP